MKWAVGGGGGCIVIGLFIEFPAHEFGKLLLAFGRYLLLLLS